MHAVAAGALTSGCGSLLLHCATQYLDEPSAAAAMQVGGGPD
jgi:hypothetical protein